MARHRNFLVSRSTYSALLFLFWIIFPPHLSVGISFVLFGFIEARGGVFRGAVRKPGWLVVRHVKVYRASSMFRAAICGTFLFYNSADYVLRISVF